MWREWMNILSGWSTAAIIGRLAIATVMGTIIGIDRGSEPELRRMPLSAWDQPL